MQDEIFYDAAYKGSKDFNQWNVKTADATGFGAAADDYMERGIDLNEQLIHNKPATFFLRMRGEAMTGAGIHDGDVVIVDKSLKPQSGKVVIAVLNGEMLIRRLERTFNKVRLLPENRQFATTEIDPSCDTLEIWGVVTYVIHHL
ncbi:MAG: LexA family protein [Pseudobacter sp.]|uniref:LexA family protein n=1 Tax=Pseudobacter sp. TaxID=2045420 RepID=UPI003F7EB4B2